MSKPKIYLREAIYIPVRFLDSDEVEEQYTKRMYDDKICRTCDFRRDRHCDACDECELGGYKGVTKFAGYKNINGERYMSLPIGDRLNIEEKTGITLKRFKIVDKRTKVPFDYPVKFTGQLRDYQVPMRDDWVESGHGLIKAPPRTGKTVTTVAIAIKLGMRAVIIADQTDFLDNFIEEMEAYTNLPRLQEKTGKKLFGYLKKPEDFKNVQIGVITYQSLISDKNGKQRLKWINENFGTMFIDEVHSANALEFSGVVSRLRLRYKGGCTATPNRKDGLHYRVAMLIGPVVHEAHADTMTPKLTVHVTDAAPARKGMYSRGPAAWTYANRFLSKHPERQKMITQAVLHDLKKGRSIVMATYFKDHVLQIVKDINDAYGQQIAYAFVGGNKKVKDERKWIIDQARDGKIRVVVGIRRLMQRGLNVPRWDTLYYAMPMSNEPNWQQESRRICTPMEGKNRPLIRMFVDPELGISLGCFRNTYKHSLALKYEPGPKAKELVRALGLSNKERSEASDDDGGMYDSERNMKRAAKKKPSKPAVEGSLFGKIRR